MCKVRGCLNSNLIGNIKPGFTGEVIRGFKGSALSIVRRAPSRLLGMSNVKGMHMSQVGAD